MSVAPKTRSTKPSVDRHTDTNTAYMSYSIFFLFLFGFSKTFNGLEISIEYRSRLVNKLVGTGYCTYLKEKKT